MYSITVVITAYRMEDYLPQCFEDLFAQTFQDFDIVVLDDASPDNTPEIIAKYAARAPSRIHMLMQAKNLGSPSKARNTVLRSGLITGTYTLFLDGDDRLEPTMLETLYSLAQAEDADMAVCAFDRIDTASGHILSHDLKWLGQPILLPPEDDSIAFLNGALWNKLIRTALMQGLEIPEFSFGEDICFGLMLTLRAKRMSTTPKALIHYQVRPQSVSTNLSHESVHRFANELYHMYTQAEGLAWKQLLSFISFLHIGLSMATRAVAHMTEMDARTYTRWSRQYLTSHFDLHRACPYLRLSSLKRHGTKGLILWLSYRCMRIGTLGPLLLAYQLVRICFGVEVKF